MFFEVFIPINFTFKDVFILKLYLKFLYFCTKGRQRAKTSHGETAHEPHRNTKNIAGMLKYRLASLGIKEPMFMDLLRYGDVFLIYILNHLILHIFLFI